MYRIQIKLNTKSWNFVFWLYVIGYEHKWKYLLKFYVFVITIQILQTIQHGLGSFHTKTVNICV